MIRSTPIPCLAIALLSAGCAGGGDAETTTLLAVKDLVADELDTLHGAATDLCAAVPTGGWQATDLDTAKEAWRDTRNAYERIEGAIAVLFPELDASTDERYDGFLAEADDDDLFDGEGVTGVHAIERILWADSHPATVVTFESTLSGYAPAAFPADEAEAAAFRDGLCQRLVDDVDEMRTRFRPLALDLAAAFEGVVGSMAEQVEKIGLASSGESESRYARHTLADMRSNLAGGRAIYETFGPWVRAQEGGEAVDTRVTAGFDRVVAGYTALSGDALPEVPATWDDADPTQADRATPYGTLWTLLDTESDPAADGSLVQAMVDAAAIIDLPIAP